jgi:hypothetical protein
MRGQRKEREMLNIESSRKTKNVNTDYSDKKKQYNRMAGEAKEGYKDGKKERDKYSKNECLNEEVKGNRGLYIFILFLYLNSVTYHTTTTFPRLYNVCLVFC